MKKITVVLLLVLTSSINAQDKKISGQEQSKNDANLLTQFLNLNENLNGSLFTLFEMKREVLDNPENSIEKKKEMVKMVGLKVQASLNPDQLKLLMSKPDIYKRFIGESTVNEVNKTK